MTNRYICIHGHFYQPPRENPWLNEVERQDSAAPYHDWNERITAECYARNAASRILDRDGFIYDIINNYSRISFNFGPTLLEWMAKKAPDVHDAIIQADVESRKRFGGHGAAMAQAYNHLIMPLANARDQHTQVIWGIRDFELRFGRKPEGMWCGETAVNTQVLDVMAEHGIVFTVLSPYQALRVRKTGETTWTDVKGGKVNPRRPYLCHLPSGRKITLFFYDGAVSQAVAFQGLLNSGEALADRLLTGFADNSEPQLMHIATDGESYGHHHRFGEMALSYALHRLETGEQARLTVYGEYLEKFPPEWEAEIIENSSWSCSHGVERWRSDCGCNTGAHPGWNQSWRGPLRDAFDWVRDTLIPVYETHMQPYSSNPWQVRNAYIAVIFDRSPEHVQGFLKQHFPDRLLPEDQSKILTLLEMQYHTMLMYTSCGWFFDEVTGLESVQDILYAARALQLATSITGTDYEPEFEKRLEKAKSNVPEYQHAGTPYRAIVKPTMLDLLRVGAHYAISSLFSDYPEKAKIYCYSAHARHYSQYTAGKQKLAIGRTLLRSEITLEEADITFAVLHLGDYQVFGGVRTFQGREAFEQMEQELTAQFEKASTYDIVVLLDKHFGAHHYSFWHLFRDEQHNILHEVMRETMAGVTSMFLHVYNSNYQNMLALKSVNMNLPGELKSVNDFVINARLAAIFQQQRPDLHELSRLVQDAKRFPAELQLEPHRYNTGRQLAGILKQLAATPEDLSLMQAVVRVMELVVFELKLDPDLWEARNQAFLIRRQHYQAQKQRAEAGDQNAQRWLETFTSMYHALNMKA